MNLTAEQLEAAENGQAVEVAANGKTFILLSREVYDQVRHVLTDEDLSPLVTARMIRAAAAEDDADDPTLESYQQYKRNP